MTGTASAQAIPILMSPLLTRIYSPEDFGLIALYISLVSIVCVVSTCRYEMAIMLPKDETEVNSVTKLLLCLSISIALIALLVVIFFGREISLFLGDERLENWLFLLPISVFLSALSQTFYYLLIRNGEFKQLAKNKIVASVSNVSVQLGVGSTLHSPVGLLLGNIAGVTFASLVIVRSKLINKYYNFQNTDITSAAKKYKNFPKYDVPSVLINLFANQLPLLILGKYFGTSVLGAYSFMYRILMAPVNLLSNSVLDVFKQKATYDYNETQNCRSVYIYTFKKLVIMATPIFLVLGLFAPEIFELVFGKNWRTAGVFAQVMSPMFFLSFIANPLSYTFFIAGKQNINLKGQLLILLGSIFSALIGIYYGDAYIFVCTFSILNCLVYILYIYLSYKFSKGIQSE